MGQHKSFIIIMRPDINIDISSHEQFGGIGGGCMMPFQCHNINLEQQHSQQQPYRSTTVTDCHKDDDDDCEDLFMIALSEQPDHRNSSPNLLKVRSKIITLSSNHNCDENKHSTIMMNIKSSSRQPFKSSGGGSSTTSGCSTQSSSSSSVSMPSALQLFRNQSATNMLVNSDDHIHFPANNNRTDVVETKDEISPNLSSRASRRHYSLTPSSSTSLSSSSITSSPSPSIRPSETQWEKIGHFIESYEQSLLQCLSSIQQQWIHQQSSTSHTINNNNHGINDCDDNDHHHDADESQDVNDEDLFQSTSSNGFNNSYKNSDRINHSIPTLQQSNKSNVNIKSLTSLPNDDSSNIKKKSCYIVKKPSTNKLVVAADSSYTYRLQLRSWIQIQLDKVVHLREQYEHGKHCQEALVKMAKLSTHSGSNRCRKNCYREWRSNERMLQSLANRLQLMIGSFEIRVEDIEGWARICPGDYYELEFRHGQQRQILRVKIVGSQLQRIWDLDRNIIRFHAALQSHITCKIKEMKSGLWRSLAVWPSKYRYVDIGTTSISLTELFQSVAEQCPLLVDCNPSGSLKLRLNCHWNPSCQDEINIDIFEKESTTRRSNLRILSSSSVHSIESNSCMVNSEKPVSMMKRKSSDQVEHQRQQKESFGINRNLARSLLSLPTFNSSLDLGDASSTLPLRIKTIESNHHTDGVDVFDKSDCISSSGSLSHYALKPCSRTSSVSTSPCSNEVNNHLESMVVMLQTLKTSLQDHYGQSIEITILSQTVARLITLYERLMTKLTTTQQFNLSNKGHFNDLLRVNDNKCFSHDQHQTNEFIEQAFEFLDQSDFDDHDNYKRQTRIRASFDSNECGLLNRSHQPPISESLLDCQNDHVEINEMISQWNRLLTIHIESATKQLLNVGTWILKSREQCAFLRLQADTFAMEQIYLILLFILKNCNRNQNFKLPNNQPFGQDSRVLELVRYLCPSNNDYSLVFTFDQFFQILLSVMRIHILINEAGINDFEKIDTLFQNSTQWLASSIFSCGSSCFYLFGSQKQPSETDLITIFHVRAFFELNLYNNHNYHHFYDRHSKNNVSMKQIRTHPIHLADFFHTAFDLNCLIAKIRTRKWPLLNVEAILFKRFSPRCEWLPPDLTLLLFNLIYEHHCIHESIARKNCISNSNHESSLFNSARSLGDVKKSDRLRELSRLINQWLMWQCQQSRFEVREHILIGLECSCPFTRQASCYGIMHLFRLMQRIQSTNLTSSMTMKVFYGKELDCLLYLSMEDADSRVRDEAKKSLQYLSSVLGKKLESDQMSFVSPGSFPNRKANINDCPTSQPSRNSPSQPISMFRNSHSWITKHTKPTVVANSILRTSMPDLSSLAFDLESIQLK
ncbi:hypothetical protein DERP_001379 [Dermatophagoides pteronyssinus]|uniref:FAM65 N-terminal domain-containing protein n=1 Tax=Dermatophagoides pteronyssinus TaxID=6956 RepID=A0ABQ8JEZ5_DERPT|nr:hypothetical protein DERP_001379 [Dermatophagoides pteronyssinus]